MRSSLLIGTLVSAVLLASSAFAQTTITSGDGVNTTSTTIGNTTFTSGTVNGQPVTTTSQTVGSTTFTNGTIGNKPVSTTATTIGQPSR